MISSMLSGTSSSSSSWAIDDAVCSPDIWVGAFSRFSRKDRFPDIASALNCPFPQSRFTSLVPPRCDLWLEETKAHALREFDPQLPDQGIVGVLFKEGQAQQRHDGVVQRG